MRPCIPECAVYKRSGGGGGEEAREVAEVEVNEREGCHMWNNEISEPFPSDVHKQETGAGFFCGNHRTLPSVSIL